MEMSPLLYINFHTELDLVLADLFYSDDLPA